MARKAKPLDGPYPILAILVLLVVGMLLGAVLPQHSEMYKQCTIQGGHVITHGSTNICRQGGMTITTWKE